MKTFCLDSYITWISLAKTVLGWEVITFWWIMFKSLCIFFIFRFHYSTFFISRALKMKADELIAEAKDVIRQCPAWNSTFWRTLFLLPTPILTRLQPLRSFSSSEEARDDAADETALPIAHHRRGWRPFLTSTSTPPQNPSPIQAVWYWIPNKTAHNSELDGWLRWNAFHIEIVLILNEFWHDSLWP